MPGPLPLRGVAAVHQRRFPSIDDEKVSISMAATSSTSSPASSSLDPSSISISQKRSRQEVHKLVREAMVRGVQPHAPTHFSTHTVDFEKAPVSTVRTLSSNGSAKNRGNGKIQRQDMKHQRSRIDADVRKSDDRFVFFEIGQGGAKWKYTLKQQTSWKEETAFNVVNASSSFSPLNNLVTFVRSCVVPDGYPDSVSASYTPYMQWRALKYLFGGAMSVFTTRSLLHAVGVSRNGAASTAMAVNWVIKDGAGRVGKLLFARQGKKFDYDMKQLRFTGDLLMELGAAVELATVAAPHLFLPLACAANVAKNVAAVASTSTRAPIYKAFARGENIGDVTAKGECISNIADLIGTGLGIFISKSNPSLMTTFAVLSCGYLCCSYKEIKSVCLPTLNRARFKSTVQSFLETGKVPSLVEGNRNENIFMPPWAKDKPFVLGARVTEAFQNPSKFLDLLPIFQDEKYLVTYNPKRRQAFAILKEAACSDDVLRASFHAQVVENIFQRSASVQDNTDSFGDIGIDTVIKESCKNVHQLFDSFRAQAISQGWIMGESLLNPGTARLCS